MTTADFSITGSTSGAFASGTKADLVQGETATFQLEASPGLDVQTTVFEVVRVGPPSATLSLSSGGVPTTPLDAVTATIADDFAAYLVRCTINGGVDASGALVPDWIRERIVVVRKFGLRPIVPGERTQYDPDAGWFEALNGLLQAASVGGLAVEAAGASAGGGTVDLNLTTDLEDGDTAIIRAVIYGQDTGGDRAWYVRTFAVERAAGVAGLFAAVGFALDFTAEEDAGWAGPSTVVDASGQAALRLGGDATNETTWNVIASVVKR